MKIISTVAISIALCALAACNNGAQEDAAGNIDANSGMALENLEGATDNAATDTGQALENQGEATGAAAENAAEDLTTNDADTNAANGM